jgi:hypothetical protein
MVDPAMVAPAVVAPAVVAPAVVAPAVVAPAVVDVDVRSREAVLERDDPPVTVVQPELPGRRA